MDLYKYLVSVRTLEIERRTLGQSLNSIEKKMNRLGNKNREPYYKNPVPDDDRNLTVGKVVSIIAGILFGIIGIYGTSIAPKLFGELFIFYVLAFLCIFLPIKWMISSKKEYQQYEEQNRKQIAQFRNDDAQRVKYELQIKSEYQTAYDDIYKVYSSTCDLLQKMYSKNILYGKYQNNIIAICMFIEYLESGRCSALEGHEGAYNIYESEIRMGLILSKLDTIISQLDDIKNNQYNLYMALNEINNTQNKIVSSLNGISGQISSQSDQLYYMSYQTRVIRQNQEISMLLSQY